MKFASIVRMDSTTQGTPGVLRFGIQAVRTMELPWRNNERGISCIPVGAYKLVWSRSPKMGMCYHVTLVEGRNNVLMHAANFAGNTELGYITELQGCIAPCTRIGILQNAKGRMQLAGLVSRPALKLFETWGDKEPITLEIS
jgi:hypothetical protein